MINRPAAHGNPDSPCRILIRQTFRRRRNEDRTPGTVRAIAPPVTPDPVLVSSAAATFHHRSHFRTYSNPIQVVGQPLCQCDALIPKPVSRTDAPRQITLLMGKSALDRVGMPFPAFIQFGAGACPEPAGGRRSALHPKVPPCGFPVGCLRADISASRFE